MTFRLAPGEFEVLSGQVERLQQLVFSRKRVTDFLGELLVAVKMNLHALRSHTELRRALVDQAVALLFGELTSAELQAQLVDFKQVLFFPKVPVAMERLPQLIMEFFQLSEKDLQVDVDVVRRLLGGRLLPAVVAPEPGQHDNIGVNIKQLERDQIKGDSLPDRRPVERPPGARASRSDRVLRARGLP